MRIGNTTIRWRSYFRYLGYRWERLRSRNLMPADFPNEEDFEIATMEYQSTGSMLAALRAVAEWRREDNV